jgi:hypothetical protein
MSFKNKEQVFPRVHGVASNISFLPPSLDRPACQEGSAASSSTRIAPRHALTRLYNTPAQRTLPLRFFALKKIFLCLWLLWIPQPVWASFTLVANGVVTQLATGLSTIDTLSGAAVDYSGNVYIVDTSSNQIIKIAPDGVTTSVLSVTGLGTPLSSPRGLAIDGPGVCISRTPATTAACRLARRARAR